MYYRTQNDHFFNYKMTEQPQDEKVVDLTGHQVELDDELFGTEATEVDLTNTRLRHVPIMQLSRVTAIQVRSERSNQLVFDVQF